MFQEPLNIPAGQWHTVRVLESGTVIMEVKDGPYIPASPTDILTISSSASNQQASFITSSQPSVSLSDASVRTSSCTSAQPVSATDFNQPDSLSLANPKVRDSKASDINGPAISDSTTCSEPCPSTEINSTVSSTFIPAPDPRAFDGGDILRQHS